MAAHNGVHVQDQAKNDEMMANDTPVANAVKPESSAPSTVHRKAQDESAEPQLMEEKTTEDPAKEVPLSAALITDYLLKLGALCNPLLAAGPC